MLPPSSFLGGLQVKRSRCVVDDRLVVRQDVHAQDRVYRLRSFADQCFVRMRQVEGVYSVRFQWDLAEAKLHSLDREDCEMDPARAAAKLTRVLDGYHALAAEADIHDGARGAGVEQDVERLVRELRDQLPVSRASSRERVTAEAEALEKFVEGGRVVHGSRDRHCAALGLEFFFGVLRWSSACLRWRSAFRRLGHPNWLKAEPQRIRQPRPTFSLAPAGSLADP